MIEHIFRNVVQDRSSSPKKGHLVKLREIYDTAIQMGIDADPRGREGVERFLEMTRRRFEMLPDYAKAVYDEEELTNPYVDTRIYVGDPDVEVTKLIGGIDMNVGEVVLTDRLREKGEKIDAIYTHHPEGMALAKLDKVMEMQAEIWQSHGVPINIGEMILDQRRTEVRRRFMPMNTEQAIDAARLLGIPFFSAHTPTDNLVMSYLQRYLDERQPLLVEDVRRILFEIPEYRIAAEKGAGPYVVDELSGKRAGKVVVDMTGGTEGPNEIMRELAERGVGTLVQMHMTPDFRKAAEENHMHVVIAGHISSDSIGVNLLMDALERRGVDIIPVSGYIRVHRDEQGATVKEGA
jgi:hypothetical protein